MDQGVGDSDKIPSLDAASPQNVQTLEREFRDALVPIGTAEPLHDRSTVRDLSAGRLVPFTLRAGRIFNEPSVEARTGD